MVKIASEKSILSAVYHARLLEDIEAVAAVAHVPLPMLHRPMAAYCPHEMVEWVKDYPSHMAAGSAGLCITGKPKGVDEKMQAIAAAFLRNYVDARVIPIHNLLKPDEDPEDPTVLLIPNFYVRSTTGKNAFTNWQTQQLYGMLLDRNVNRKATIIYVQSMDQLAAEYGEAVHDLIEYHYQVI